MLAQNESLLKYTMHLLQGTIWAEGTRRVYFLTSCAEVEGSLHLPPPPAGQMAQEQTPRPSLPSKLRTPVFQPILLGCGWK